MDQLNVSNYDLTCFGITACGPNDFQALIQFLITQICELQGVTPTTKENTTGCPDCLVTVAPCFVVGGQTTMNLTDYVNMIAERICDIIDELVIINAALVDLNIRVTTLENAIPPSFTIPSYITDCQIGSLAPANWDIDVILEAFTNEVWCPFYDATGTTSEILAAVAAQCIFGTSLSKKYPGVQMQIAYPSWDATPDTLASTINNIWISLCDLYSSSFTVADTNTINLTNTAGILTANIQDTGWVDLNGFDFYAGNSEIQYKPRCRRIGNVVHFRGILMIPLSSGGSLIDWNYGTGDSYAGITTTTPYTGAGGVTIDTGGSVTFNSNNSVIPSTIMGAGENFEFIVQSNYVTASRYILLPSGDSAMLTNVVKIWITDQKKLLLQYLIDNEYSAGGKVANITGTSVLNTLVSRVNLGDYVPQFARAGSEIAGNNTSGLQNLTATYYAGTETYPFTCDAGNPSQSGGFGWLSLDGMMAYISPCTTDIPVSKVCS